MLTSVVAIIVLVVSVGLFRTAMPSRSGRKRWFIGTAWEPYVTVILVVGVLLSVVFFGVAVVELLIGLEIL